MERNRRAAAARRPKQVMQAVLRPRREQQQQQLELQARLTGSTQVQGNRYWPMSTEAPASREK